MELFFRLSLLLIQLVLLKNRIAKADIAGCHFYDTVKLTSSQRSQNGSYFYQGVEIPPDQTGEYSYIMLPDGKREPVQSHWRGCVCKLKTCIRLCCPPNQYMDEDIVCTDGLEKETWSGHYVNITSGTSVKRLDFHKDFILQGHLPQPCQDLYELEENSGALFENGTFLRFEDSKSLSKQNYCIQPQKLNDSIRILPYNCAIETGPDWGKTVAISTSLFCIIVTIAVYCLAGMLKSFNNVCLIFYMACLGFGSLIELLDTWHVTDNKLCEPTGYLGYFFILSAFCWLSVISRNVGRSIGKCRPTTTQNHSMKKYLKYSGFAWGIPAFLTIAIVLLDFTMNKEQYESWMPGIGFYNCWIKTEDMSAMIYLYGPILILSTYNITVFIHAATKIVKIKMKTRKLFNSGESQISTGADSDMEIFLTCIKLFLVMGLSWGLVIITYLVQKDGLWSTILLPTDYINYSQGTIILVVVLSTKSTRRLLMERFKSKPAVRTSNYSQGGAVTGTTESTSA